MNTMDPFTTGKLVNFKQADLRAEAQQTALREALTEKSKVSQRLLSIGVIRSAARAIHRVGKRGSFSSGRPVDIIGVSNRAN
jgi:hypothetical protein